MSLLVLCPVSILCHSSQEQPEVVHFQQFLCSWILNFYPLIQDFLRSYFGVDYDSSMNWMTQKSCSIPWFIFWIHQGYCQTLLFFQCCSCVSFCANWNNHLNLFSSYCIHSFLLVLIDNFEKSKYPLWRHLALYRSMILIHPLFSEHFLHSLSKSSPLSFCLWGSTIHFKHGWSSNFEV